jgi:hypothetical protein
MLANTALSIGNPLNDLLRVVTENCARPIRHASESLPSRRQFLSLLARGAACLGVTPPLPSSPEDPLAYLGPKEYRHKMIQSIVAKTPGAFNQAFALLVDRSCREASTDLVAREGKPFNIAGLEKTILNSKPCSGLALIRNLLAAKPITLDANQLHDAKNINHLLSDEHIATFGSTGQVLNRDEIGFIRKCFRIEDLPAGQDFAQGAIGRVVHRSYTQLPPSPKRDAVLTRFEKGEYPRRHPNPEATKGSEKEEKNLISSSDYRYISPSWAEGEQLRAREFESETVIAPINLLDSSPQQHND